MATKTYGYDRNGNVSECTAQERNRGKGRCNHYGHFNVDNKQELIEKTEAIQAELNNDVNAGMIAHNVSRTLALAEREFERVHAVEIRNAEQEYEKAKTAYDAVRMKPDAIETEYRTLVDANNRKYAELDARIDNMSYPSGDKELDERFERAFNDSLTDKSDFDVDDLKSGGRIILHKGDINEFIPEISEIPADERVYADDEGLDYYDASDDEPEGWYRNGEYYADYDDPSIIDVNVIQDAVVHEDSLDITDHAIASTKYTMHQELKQEHAEADKEALNTAKSHHPMTENEEKQALDARVRFMNASMRLKKLNDAKNIAGIAGFDVIRKINESNDGVKTYENRLKTELSYGGHVDYDYDYDYDGTSRKMPGDYYTSSITNADPDNWYTVDSVEYNDSGLRKKALIDRETDPYVLSKAEKQNGFQEGWMRVIDDDKHSPESRYRMMITQAYDSNGFNDYQLKQIRKSKLYKTGGMPDFDRIISIIRRK